MYKLLIMQKQWSHWVAFIDAYVVFEHYEVAT